ncbi:MAG: hypothetical protein H8E48_15190 [Chloroflexi bacterium]|nr:hypothetical protein [Chloroflexota bacterium]
MLIVLGCSSPDFRTFSDPVMDTDSLQAELERLHEINLSVGDDAFDPNVYPISVGVDVRNGQMLVEKFICWDACPDVGMVFLMYANVGTEADCLQVIGGSSLISPEPMPGVFWGCRPVVDWLNKPPKHPARVDRDLSGT